MAKKPRTERRILEPRLPAIRKRLREARGDRSLQMAKDAIEESSRKLKLGPNRKGIQINRTDVRRFEGSDKARPNATPSPDYVRAAAHAFGVKEVDLFAEDVPGWPLESLRQKYEQRRSERELQLRLKHGGPRDGERDRLRDQVSRILVRVCGVPPPQRPIEEMPHDVLAWIHDRIERLFWEAFWHRGLSEEELLKKAYDFARSIPSPPRLSGEGFRRYEEIDEGRLKRWWASQEEAYRALMNPNTTFTPEEMNLGRYGQGGFPEPFEKYVGRFDEWFDEEPEISEEEALKIARTEPPEVDPIKTRVSYDPTET